MFCWVGVREAWEEVRRRTRVSVGESEDGVSCIHLCGGSLRDEWYGKILTSQLLRTLVRLGRDQILRDRVALQALCNLPQLLDPAHGILEALQGDLAVELVDLALHPAQVLVFAVHLDHDVWAVGAGIAELPQQVTVVGEGRVFGGQVIHVLPGLVAVLLHLRPHRPPQLVRRSSEVLQQFHFVRVCRLVAAVGEGFVAATDADRVRHATLVLGA